MIKKKYAYHLFIALAAAATIASPLSLAEETVAPSPDITESMPTVEAQVKIGKNIFKNTCSHCHTTTYDESAIRAPGLRGVLERHDETWLHQWIKSPEAFAKTNVTARDLIDSNPFGLAMPALPVMQDNDNRSAIIEYLKTLK